MDLMLLRMFQKQILIQCEFILFAASDVNSGLQSRDHIRVFYGLQNLLNSAANISKVLWGQAGSKEVERKPIRDSIGVADSSPLRSVTMRNNFEHFDERLDKWWRESKQKNNVDLSIMPKSSISGFDDIDRFRMFDPKTTDLYFWGQEFTIQEIITEVERILPKLREEAAKPHWEEPPKE